MHDVSSGSTLWLTGLPCAGKTTVAVGVAARLMALGVAVEVLDGDVMRRTLGADLGFSRADRDTHVRRVAARCRQLNEAGVVAIAALVSPYRTTRDEVRRSISAFFEVFVDCPLEECVRRDVKGMYAQAKAGALSGFTGVGDPYEPPLAAEIVLRTAEETPDESVGRVMARLAARLRSMGVHCNTP